MKRNRKEYRLCFYLDNPQQKYIVDNIDQLLHEGNRKKSSKEVITDILYMHFKDADRAAEREKEGTSEWYIKHSYEMLRTLLENDAAISQEAMNKIGSQIEAIEDKEADEKSISNEEEGEELSQGIMDFIDAFN